MKLPHSSLFTLFFAASLAQASMPPSMPRTARPSAAEENPNPGPRSADEPKLLWEEAQKDIARDQTQLAANKLNRLIGRYPRDPRVAEATATLVRLELELEQPDAAIADARRFLLVDSRSERAQGVRALLAEAYLKKQKHTEARATAKELLARSRDESTRGRALLILARIETLLGNFKDARARLDALPASYTADDKNALLLEIGVRQCDTSIRFPQARVRREDPWIQFIESKNSCLKSLVAGPHVAGATGAYPVWCKSFYDLNTTLASRPLNEFQKNRLRTELGRTGELAQPFQCGNP